MEDPSVFLSVKNITPRDEEEKNSLSLIRSFLVRSVLGSKIRDLTDKVREIEAKAEITLEETKIPYRAAWSEIKREGRRSRREEIDRKRRDIVLNLNPDYLRVFEIMHGTSLELGFESYIRLSNEIEKLDLDELEKRARPFLKETEYVYRDLLQWFLDKKMGVGLKDAKRHDLSFMFNSFELKGNFPKRDLLGIAKRCLQGMDIQINDNIKLDVEKREGKTSRAFFSPIEVPNKIMIVIYPTGGVEDYESFFHELGHALHYGHAAPDDEFEFRRLREVAESEVFAFLFE